MIFIRVLKRHVKLLPMSKGYSRKKMIRSNFSRTGRRTNFINRQVFPLDFHSNSSPSLQTPFNFSIFYVYYEQYLTIWKDSVFSLMISLAAIFIVSFILTGCDLIAAFIILFMVTLIVINMMGMMWLWNISLNAISLVNLVVVSVEKRMSAFIQLLASIHLFFNSIFFCSISQLESV